MLLVHQQENQNQIESNAYIELKEARNKKTYSNKMKSCSNFDNIKLFVTISKAFINLTMKASVQLYCGWLRGEASTSNNAIAEKQLRMLNADLKLWVSVIWGTQPLGNKFLFALINEFDCCWRLSKHGRWGIFHFFFIFILKCVLNKRKSNCSDRVWHIASPSSFTDPTKKKRKYIVSHCRTNANQFY